MAEIIKTIFWKETFFLRLFEYYLLILKIWNGKVVENIFREIIGHDLWKSEYFLKISKKR